MRTGGSAGRQAGPHAKRAVCASCASTPALLGVTQRLPAVTRASPKRHAGVTRRRLRRASARLPLRPPGPRSSACPRAARPGPCPTRRHRALARGRSAVRWRCCWRRCTRCSRTSERGPGDPASVQLDVDLDHRVGLGVVDPPDGVRIVEPPDVARVLEVVNGGGGVAARSPSLATRPRLPLTDRPRLRSPPAAQPCARPACRLPG